MDPNSQCCRACTSTLGNRVASGGTVLNSTSASVIVVSCPPNTDVWLECSEDEKEATLAAPILPPPPSPLFDDAMFTMFIPLPTDPLEDEQKISLQFHIFITGNSVCLDVEGLGKNILREIGKFLHIVHRLPQLSKPSPPPKCHY